MQTRPVRIVAGTLVLCAVLVGCNERETVKTVSWYRAHPNERRAQVERCADDPGNQGRSPNCTNALQAESIEGIGSFRDLPPLDLGKPSTSSEDEGDHILVRP